MIKKILIGKEALKKSNEPKKIIYDFMNLLGKDFRDKHVQKFIEYFKCEIYNKVCNKKEKFVIEIENNENKYYFSPEQIVSIIINKLKQDGERYYNNNIKKVVFSVPCNFNNNQRQLLKMAIENAGLEPLRIINKPTAALLAYNLEKKGQKILDISLDKYNLEITLLKVDDKNFYNDLSILDHESSYLGEDYFVCKIVDFCLYEFCKNSKKDKEINKEEIMKDKFAINRIKTASESLIKRLNFYDETYETYIEIDDFYDNKNLFIYIKDNIL